MGLGGAWEMVCSEWGRRALEYYVRKAISLGKVGHRQTVAFALRNGKIIGYGTNSFGDSNRHQRRLACAVGTPDRKYLHAEVHAICRAKGRIHTLVVVRLDSKGNPVLAKPCPICQLAIKENGIKNVFWT